jgi:aspartate/methionine/tyrosine aminotransferase
MYATSDAAGNRPSLHLSARAQTIPQALSVYINQLVYDLRRRNRDIITLSLGEAFFDIPAFSFERLDFVRGYHYSDSQGIPALRKRIAGYYNARYGASIDPSDILISAGSKPVLLMVMMAVLDPGDRVAIHEPAWLSYQEQARLCGAEVHFVPHDVPVEQFHQHLVPGVKLVIINNPNNPAGRVYSKEELLSLYDQCRNRGAYLLVDEAYSDFVLDGSFHCVPELFPTLEGVIAVNSLSKNMGMSGWRVGYAIAEPRMIAALLKLNQHIITCGPTILLQYLAEYFDDILAHTLPQVRAVVEKRARIAKRLEQLGFRCLAGATTFYFFVSVGDYGEDVHELALYLLLGKGISLVPGAAYGLSTERFLRMSIGTESEERIDEALQTLQSVLMEGVVPGFVAAELERLKLPTFANRTP